MATYNRSRFIRDAIRSVCRQQFADWELLVINDGGRDVGALIKSFRDPRIRYFNQAANRGKPACINLALRQARAPLIAYLDDDDIWYENHLSRLVPAIEGAPAAVAAYSMLYEVDTLVDPRTKQRCRLDKSLHTARSYKRDVMFCFNIAPHVSVVHRRHRVLQAGGYAEHISTLDDWLMNRKLAFYGDFVFVPRITGEYYKQPEATSDRNSDTERRTPVRFRHSRRQIKAELPPEPWSGVDSIAVLLPVQSWGAEVRQLLAGLLDSIHYPVRYMLINDDTGRAESDCRAALGALADFPVISICTPRARLGLFESYQYGAAQTGADYFFLAGPLTDITVSARIMLARAHIEQCNGILRWDTEKERWSDFDVFITRERLLACSPGAFQQQQREARRIPLGAPPALAYDYHINMVGAHRRNGNPRAALQCVSCARNHNEAPFDAANIARAYYELCIELQHYDELERELNRAIIAGYGADNWIRLGALRLQRGDHAQALAAFRQGLSEIGITNDDLQSALFPIAPTVPPSSFDAFMGIGACQLAAGNFEEARAAFDNARLLNSASEAPRKALVQVAQRQKAAGGRIPLPAENAVGDSSVA